MGNRNPRLTIEAGVLLSPRRPGLAGKAYPAAVMAGVSLFIIARPPEAHTFTGGKIRFMYALFSCVRPKRLEYTGNSYQHLRDGGVRVNVETHVRTSRQHHGAGDLYAARAEIERARAFDPTGRDLVHVLITAGIVNREIGDIAAAIDDLQQCIGLLPDYPDLAAVMLGPAWYNLGLALRQARRLQESIDAYGVAIGLFRADSMTDYLRMALQNRAWAYCVAGDAVSAGADLAESDPLSTTVEARAQQRIGEAFVLSLTGANADALRLCSSLAEDSGAPADVSSHALWLAGRMAFAAGAHTDAEVLALQAVERAARCGGENRCLADASDLLAQVRQENLRGGVSA